MSYPRTSRTLLVIEDEKQTSALLRNTLQPEYEVIVAERGDDGLEIAQQHAPDLVLLDVQLPGLDGIEVCRRLRGDPRTRSMPIIMLTGMREEVDRIIGLEMGADDYVTKPFSPREVRARVHALLRRSMMGHSSGDIIQHGALMIDVNRHEVRYADRLVSLTATQFRILHYLAARAGEVRSREQISDAVHEGDVAAFERTIDVHIKGIRQRLADGGQIIETVRGVGYRLR